MNDRMNERKRCIKSNQIKKERERDTCDCMFLIEVFFFFFSLVYLPIVCAVKLYALGPDCDKA
jgi:hypothetical protein